MGGRKSEEVCKRTGVIVDVHCEPEVIQVDPGRSTTIFRMFQEALTNVLRHAHASKVEVSIVKAGNILSLTIQDNGRGISEKEILNRGSLGLLGMRERALVWGGQMDIKGVLGVGTTVTIEIPLEKP